MNDKPADPDSAMDAAVAAESEESNGLCVENAGFEGEELTIQDEVYMAITGLIKDRRLKSRRQPLHIFRGKEYTSRDGWGASPLDISLEAGSPDLRDGYLLVAISCIEGDERITRDDVEEFAGRLAKIGGPVVGLIVSTRAIYKDAFKKVGSLGIGLVRMLPDSQVLWLNINMSPLSFREYDRIDPGDFTRAFFDPAHMGQNRSFYAFSDHYLFGDWISLLEHHLQ